MVKHARLPDEVSMVGITALNLENLGYREHLSAPIEDTCELLFNCPVDSFTAILVKRGSNKILSINERVIKKLPLLLQGWASEW